MYQSPPFPTIPNKKMRKRGRKAFTFPQSLCIIKQQPKYGGAPDSIAGERKDKHTADEVTASSTFHLNLNANRNANYALAA